ncbi:hypothetical protein [Streptomyces albipurpureus]|uniref:Transposase n=1 Tax=Streptomyces albipurpureus TaxID=2897419 RepID=A0ABT0UG60_9ACTN|nr:hypothetical protein [Streptomyces sp. CWNU-1]MCM2387613.1 hypothetical protein [Streptomyces sp. CWNU-1]
MGERSPRTRARLLVLMLVALKAVDRQGRLEAAACLDAVHGIRTPISTTSGRGRVTRYLKQRGEGCQHVRSVVPLARRRASVWALPREAGCSTAVRPATREA